MKNNDKLNEKFILDKYLRRLNFKKKETFNFQNDGSIIKNIKGKDLVVTNDTIVEKVDFFLNDPSSSLAHKIICYNLSDLSSMGATPYAYTLSLCLSSKINRKWLEDFVKKLFLLQKKYNFFLLGGDISNSKNIVISANFFGFVKSNQFIKRTNPNINDNIWITGNIGDSSIGLKIKRNKISLNPKISKYFLRKYLYPNPCMIGYKLNKIATSAIDISDGVYGDLNQIIENTNYGAYIYLKNLPYSYYLKNLIKNKIIDKNYILSSGDDYQLLFTANKSKNYLIKKVANLYNVKFSNIGKIIDNKGIYIDGKKLIKRKKSFQHVF